MSKRVFVRGTGEFGCAKTAGVDESNLGGIAPRYDTRRERYFVTQPTGSLRRSGR